MVAETVRSKEFDLEEATGFARISVLKAGETLLRSFKRGDFTSTQKPGVDFTTDADIEADRLLRQQFSTKYPDHQFLTEETAPEDYSSLQNAENLWVIDPLDGTINFSRGNPHFAISVALMQKGKVVLAIISAPVEQKIYVANNNDDSAYLNGGRVEVSGTQDLREVVLGCDWGWDLKKRANIVDWLDKVSGSIRQVASRGSAVADLASLAEGKIDAYFHSGLKPWDMAAASLIVTKAGGMVTDVDGSEWTPFKKEILATNGRLHDRILTLLGPSPNKY